VVGGEGRGLSASVRRRCDLLVRIPMHGRIESLNAAVAGSILLYEAAAQRDLPGDRPLPSSQVLGTADDPADDPADEPADEPTAPDDDAPPMESAEPEMGPAPTAEPESGSPPLEPAQPPPPRPRKPRAKATVDEPAVDAPAVAEPAVDAPAPRTRTRRAKSAAVEEAGAAAPATKPRSRARKASIAAAPVDPAEDLLPGGPAVDASPDDAGTGSASTSVEGAAGSPEDAPSVDPEV
jgi:hypothetical protein